MKMELIILKCYRIIGDELPVSLFILMMQVKTPASEPAGGCDRLLIIRRPAAESKTVARQAGTFVPPLSKPLQAPVHNGCSHSRLSGHKKKALCLLVNLKTQTDNSTTSRLPKFRLIALSFLACWAKRKLSYWR